MTDDAADELTEADRGARRAARVAELFERVGLAPALASRSPHRFSGGQRGRA